MHGEDLTVILPTLNEEGNIASLISEIKNELPACVVVVIDDKSEDKTLEEAIKCSEKFENVLALSRDSNRRCLTDSIQMGIDVSQTEFVGWMDADH